MKPNEVVIISVSYYFFWSFLMFMSKFDLYFKFFGHIQGDPVARGPKLLSIKNYVIEIMT